VTERPDLWESIRLGLEGQVHVDPAGCYRPAFDATTAARDANAQRAETDPAWLARLTVQEQTAIHNWSESTQYKTRTSQ